MWGHFNTLRTGDANLRLYAYKQFKYPVPNVLSSCMKHWTRPHQTGSLRWTTWSKIKACIAKSSCEIYTSVRYNTVKSGDYVLILWDNLLVPFSTVKKSKRENSMTEVNWHTLLFWGFNKHDVSEAGSVSVFRQLTPNLADPSIELFSITGHHRNSNLLRYVPENKSSPRVVIGKLLLKN
jgi:hypothetical protein